MWSYYGSKRKIAHLYPKPIYELIIEPFAGSAWYSVLHRNKNVILNDKYEVIHDIWDWLINSATSDTILKNSDFFVGQDISNLELDKAHKDLIGFSINRGSVAPCNIVQKWNCQVSSNPEWASTTNFQLKRISTLLAEIKHWKVSKKDYTDLDNIECTWFIDPPYQFGGERYKVSDVNYATLREWIMTRKGQVIVCENSKAQWLNFSPLCNTFGQKKTIE